ncbi:ATP-binding protein [Desulfobacula sp.]|uniref:ATP-binding protein n=1 Tax=Desulfobacula sp. TaxID=2593537 RepID=UPI001EC1F0BA|nr:ATP-binding protein [Desulfobacula sp.]
MKTIISQLIDDFQERNLPAPIFRTKLFFEIKGKADVVIGMRRAGKTWFCFQKINQLLKKISRNQILYLNFEDERLLGFTVSNFQEILDVYYGKFPENKNKKCYFFLDELQRIDQWEMFIRRLLDSENIQVFITGSSSKLLSTEIATSLRGRSLTTEIFPFSFQEFLRYHGLFADKPGSFGSKTAAILRKAVKEYSQNGGFPEVQNIDANTRTEILQGYIDSVLLKDVIERHGVNNFTAMKHLVRTLMSSSGKKFSINKFYNTLKSMSVKCTKNNLYDYLDHLTDAFVFYRIPIHSRSEKSRMINPVKIYTIDTGLKNAMIFQNSSDFAPILENMVFLHLRRHNYQIEYINTRKGFETDFFARNPITDEIKLIQVCWQLSDQKTFDREYRGLQSAMEEFSIPSGTIVTWDDEAQLDNNINAVPIWKWLLDD